MAKKRMDEKLYRLHKKTWANGGQKDTGHMECNKAGQALKTLEGTET